MGLSREHSSLSPGAIGRLGRWQNMKEAFAQLLRYRKHLSAFLTFQYDTQRHSMW
jgi:hypothetical protein